MILTAPDGALLDWVNEYGAQLDFDAGSWLGVFGGIGEVTVDAFTLGADHEVAAGTHDRSRVQLEGQTATTEAVSFYGAAEYRNFFGGHAWLFDT